MFAQANAGGYTYFLNSGDQMIGEYNSSGVLQRRYVHGPGVDEPLVWYEGSGTSTRRYFHQDERGSVIAVSDNSGNRHSSSNRYDEYGVPQGTLTGRFGYTGQMWLPEVGLYHYRARAYNPALGRFMQTDPIGYGAGMNLYAYVLNDPVSFVDPSGLQVECIEPEPDGSCSDIGVTGKRLRFSGGGILSGGGSLSPTRYFSGDGGGAGEGEQPDRCEAKSTPAMPGGAPPVFVDINKLAAVAQLKFLQHSFGSFGLMRQSTFGGIITDGATLAEVATQLILTRTHVPAGGLNVRITGNVGAVVGRDIRSNLPSTTYLTVILGPLQLRDNAIPERYPISMHPGC